MNRRTLGAIGLASAGVPLRYLRPVLYSADFLVAAHFPFETASVAMEPSSIYSDHIEQREGALPPPERLDEISSAIIRVFGKSIQYREVPFVLFDQVTVDQLAEAFHAHPVLVKSILASVNVAQRAIKRDLGVDIDTYAVTMTRKRAAILAGYIKPMLPKEIAVPALLMLDQYFWIDKEMRAGKGRWEAKVTRILNELGTGTFRKRKFTHGGAPFELDAAFPAETTETILIGVDVKRFESRRDFHKRGDEITQKVSHLKSVNPEARFYAVIYYPFPSLHDDVRQRYAGQSIDGIFFAGETEASLRPAAVEILEANGMLKEE